MKGYEVDMTIVIHAMNEESADNKLDKFLEIFDLKKYETIELKECTELIDPDSDDYDFEDLDDEEETELDLKKEPRKPAPKQNTQGKDEDWEDEWEEW